eukprot:TRINITY_DN9891_c0_g1_i1.p1 TRINITY_DN9891_c0_g1~~TRINITY_DN9891_c0_g1_i1.p1  ORF type:complete len:234 (+),score=50.05 TRINITY_DN9891_c0_g1_i1:81-782(+)
MGTDVQAVKINSLPLTEAVAIELPEDVQNLAQVNPPPLLTYREVVASDVDELRELHNQLFPIVYNDHFYDRIISGTHYSMIAIDPDAPEAQKLVGFVTLDFKNASACEDSEILHDPQPNHTLAYIMTIGVKETYQRRGIAHQLLNYSINYARSFYNCKGIHLHVIHYNSKAISFYEKHGFTKCHHHEKYYHIQGTDFDAFTYALFFNGGRQREADNFIVGYFKAFWRIIRQIF